MRKEEQNKRYMAEHKQKVVEAVLHKGRATEKRSAYMK
jgi:hypothetical protein